MQSLNCALIVSLLIAAIILKVVKMADTIGDVQIVFVFVSSDLQSNIHNQLTVMTNDLSEGTKCH